MFKRLFGKKPDSSSESKPPPMWYWIVDEAIERAADAITPGFLTDWASALGMSTFNVCSAFSDCEKFPEFSSTPTDKVLALRLAAFASNWLTEITINDHPEMFTQNGVFDDLSAMIVADMRNVRKSMYPYADPVLDIAIALHKREFSNPDGRPKSQTEMLNAFTAIATHEETAVLSLDGPDDKLAVAQFLDGMRRMISFTSLLAAHRNAPVEFLNES